MVKTISTTIYTFVELSDKAKDVARSWYRETLDPDYTAVLYDANQLASLMGISIDTRNGSSEALAIYFSGFCSQGDGACFYGTYNYAKVSQKAVREHAPLDTTLHSIVDRLHAVQKRNFYSLKARICKNSLNYCHSNSVDIEVMNKNHPLSIIVPESDCEEIETTLRDFMNWIYKQLEAEYDHCNSDAEIYENIKCNGYWFYENGKPAPDK